MEDPIRKLHEAAATSRYPLDAFNFVRRGLDHTVQAIHEQPDQLSERERHVSAQQLLEGIRQFALDEYGQMARLMLQRWNIHRTEDIGQIVFEMVNAGVMQATEQDDIQDFAEGYDFETAFEVAIPVDDVPVEDTPQNMLTHE